MRNPQKTSGLEHLHKLSVDHPGRLKLFKADLLESGSFDAAMAGCQLVMHTASPFLLSGFTDAQEALIRPALEGTPQRPGLGQPHRQRQTRGADQQRGRDLRRCP